MSPSAPVGFAPVAALGDVVKNAVATINSSTTASA